MSIETTPSSVSDKVGTTTTAPSSTQYSGNTLPLTPPFDAATASSINASIIDAVPNLYQIIHGGAGSYLTNNPADFQRHKTLAGRYREDAEAKRLEAEKLQEEHLTQRFPGGRPKFIPREDKDKDDLEFLLAKSSTEETRSEETSTPSIDSKSSSDAGSTSGKAARAGMGLKRLMHRVRKAKHRLIGTPLPESTKDSKSPTVDVTTSSGAAGAARTTEVQKKPENGFFAQLVTWLVSRYVI